MRRFVAMVAVAALAVVGHLGLSSVPAGASVHAASVAVARTTSVKTYSYGSDGSQTYDVYRSSSRGLRPTVVIIHGGGWVSGDKRDRSQVNKAQRFVAEGYTAISVNYRLLRNGVTLDQSVADASAALNHIRGHAVVLGVDKQRIAVFGGSAGGHLAMMLGTLGRGRDRVQAVVASAGMPALQLQNEVAEFGRGKAALLVSRARPHRGLTKPAWYGKVDPYASAGAGDAPLLWLGATADTYVHPELPWRMAGRLKWAGVPAKVVVADDATHGLLEASYAHREHAWQQVLDWVDARLAGRTPAGSRMNVALSVRRSGGAAVVWSSVRTNETPDSAPFSAPYRLYVARKSGSRLAAYTVAGSGRLSSRTAIVARMSRTVAKVPAGSRVKLVVDGNGAPTVRIATVK
jgi:acetyl esterase/lipase